MTAPWCGDREPRARVLLDQQHRPAAVVQRADALEHHLARLRVETHGRLVHQDHAWFEHQRACDLDQLLLAAAERARLVAPPLADQREALGEGLRPPPDEALVLEDVPADQQVVPDGHEREQASLLRDVHGAELEHLARPGGR